MPPVAGAWENGSLTAAVRVEEPANALLIAAACDGAGRQAGVVGRREVIRFPDKKLPLFIREMPPHAAAYSCLRNWHLIRFPTRLEAL